MIIRVLEANAQMVFQLQIYLRMYIYIWEHEALKS